jgi:eukaryotic-like serine/threonine-protein kinase
MIVTCEQCEAAFDIEDRFIKPGGTKLRCAQCKHVFIAHPDPPSPSAASVPPAPRAHSPAHPDPSAADPVPPGGSEPTPETWSDDDSVSRVDFSEAAFDRPPSRRYVELGTIGQGGMGEVKLARDTQLLRRVAVKKLRKDATNPATLSYFLREAQITAQLDHPNIVPLYTVKQPDDSDPNVSFVMKLVRGQTLSDVIRSARDIYKADAKATLPPELNLETRLGYFLKACEGVIYAHRKEVIHRDLKPSNIMVGDFGEVYVMDWGIAKLVREIPETLYGIQRVAASKSDLYIGGTRAGNVVGTPGYISPEQVRGLPEVGPASDQFSLGLILYELTTLKPARPGNLEKKLSWAEDGQCNRLAHLLPEKKIPAELRAIIRKATAFEESDRYPTVAALADEVRRFLRGDEVSVLPDNLFRKTWRWMNHHRQIAAILLLSFLLITSVLTIGTLVREKAAMRTGRIREKKLTHLLTKVATQAHFIDSRFLRLENLLINLANHAAYLIGHAPPNDERLYWQEDFLAPGQGPPDLAESSLYGREVSIDYPVAVPAPGVDRETIRPLMRRLAPLRHHFRKTFLDSRGSFAPLREEEVRRLMTIHGLPVSWAFIGLEAGVMYSYPGKGSYAPDYDPRLRPWYALGARKSAVYWGNPYIDIQGLGRVLPCATSIYDADGNFVGVVGMDVTYDTIIEQSLTRRGAVGIVESYLLDDKGRIVVRSGRMDMEPYSASDSGLRLELFPVPEVVSRVRRRESGFVETNRDGEERIVFFHEIPSLDWFYAEDIRATIVLGPDE